ncbi:MAG: flagellar hook-length control protein FliK [Alphaproteobacteria bacterium]|nr:flagellar hook-length control protein FliK [Alphaproteobacteria bacterium]
MNFNIANLGSLPNDHMPANAAQLDLANIGAVEDDHFAHMLRNEGRREEQASFDAKDRDARDAAERIDSRDAEHDRSVQSKHEDQNDDLAEDVDAEQSENAGNSDEHRDDERQAEERQDDEGRANQQQGNQQPADAAAVQGSTNTPLNAQSENSQAQANRPEQAVLGEGAEQRGSGEGSQQQGAAGDGRPGEQTADAARMAAAAGMNQSKPAETLINLVNREAVNLVQGPQAGQTGSPDLLAAGSLPIPIQNKQAGLVSQNEGTGKGDGMPLEQQIQVQGKRHAAPHLRGGRAKHGGDIMPYSLPRPQTGQAPAGGILGPQQPGMTPQTGSAADPAMNGAAANNSGTDAALAAKLANADSAAEAAKIATSDTGSAARNQAFSAAMEHAGQAEPPMPTPRPDSAPVATSAIPKPLAAMATDGEGSANPAGLSDDSGKGGSNAASANSNSSSAANAASKAATITQQAATADLRSPGIQVAMHLSKAVQNGIDRLSIRLDPAELGRVDVKLEVGHDGRAIALVAAERPETLELLKSDARALEKALQDAGLETDAGSLSFSLSQGDQQGGALADNGSANGGRDGNGTGEGAGADGEEAGTGEEVLPQVVSDRVLDISV